MYDLISINNERISGLDAHNLTLSLPAVKDRYSYERGCVRVREIQEGVN
jgi:hypothetical protein